jgi:DNA-binding NarL/FixJ family response regulator
VIRVLIVDDQELVRAGIRMILATEPDLELAGEVADGAEAAAAVDETSPDVVLMDIRMPTMNGIEATRAILDGRERAPKVLVLTTFNADDYVYHALRAGAAGFLLKDAPSDQLVAAIRTVSEGVSLLTPSVTQQLVERFAPVQPPSRDPRLDELTPREVDVLRSLARGLSNNEIARSLHLSEATVKTHVNHLLTKLDLTSRTQAVVFGYESGLVRVGGEAGT